MPSAVLDSTVLVSAFLTPGDAADALLNQAKAGRFLGVLAEAIVAETARVLLERPHIRQRYPYIDADVQTYLQGLRQAALLVSTLPPLIGIVRDPNDDMILACAVAASASHVVTRDPDLLSLDTYAGLAFVPIPTNSGMRAGITSRRRGMIPGPFRIIWGIRTFSIRCATPPWPPTDSNASGRIKPYTASEAWANGQ